MQLKEYKIEGKKITQKEFILQKIASDGEVTRNYALRNYISRLGSIMCNLKKEGYEFDREYIKVSTSWGQGGDYKYIPTKSALIEIRKIIKS